MTFVVLVSSLRHSNNDGMLKIRHARKTHSSLTDFHNLDGNKYVGFNGWGIELSPSHMVRNGTTAEYTYTECNRVIKYDDLNYYHNQITGRNKMPNLMY